MWNGETTLCRRYRKKSRCLSPVWMVKKSGFLKMGKRSPCCIRRITSSSVTGESNTLVRNRSTRPEIGGGWKMSKFKVLVAAMTQEQVYYIDAQDSVEAMQKAIKRFSDWKVIARSNRDE